MTFISEQIESDPESMSEEQMVDIITSLTEIIYQDEFPRPIPGMVRYRSYRSPSDKVMTRRGEIINVVGESPTTQTFLAMRDKDYRPIRLRGDGAVLNTKCRHPYLGPMILLEVYPENGEFLCWNGGD